MRQIDNRLIGRMNCRCKQMKPLREPSNTKLVVVVDDDHDVADSLALALRAHGHQVKAVYCGRDAVEFTKQLSPAVVVSDIEMPGMSGLEAARAIRSLQMECQPCLVATTGAAGAEIRVAASSAGFDRFLVKPTDLDVLLELIAAC